MKEAVEVKMMQGSLSLVVLALSVMAIYLISILINHQQKSQTENPQALSTYKLNKWLIGLSAAATANSGFVVTGAVGLGYGSGLSALWLPVGFFLADVLFWKVFPKKINEFGQHSGANTLADLLTWQTSGQSRLFINTVVALIVLVFLGGYISAQWIAGGKFIHHAFHLDPAISLVVFASSIVLYTAIGGFKGSVLTDVFLSMVRILGTLVILATIVATAFHANTFQHNIGHAGSAFLNPLPEGIGFLALAVLGYFSTSLGFSLSQPQLISRYLAGKDGQEAQSAWWIYLSFVYGTWVSMTVFGILLRGVMPGIADQEAGLIIFFQTAMPEWLTAMMVTTVFCTIAATANSLLIAIAQSVNHDLLPLMNLKNLPVYRTSLVIGAITMLFALLTQNQSISQIVLGALSIMGAGLAPAIIIRLMGWQYTPLSIAGSIVAGVASASLWKTLMFYNAAVNGLHLNESLIGIFVAFAVNAVFVLFKKFPRLESSCLQD
jgi:sodium/proline symporter